MSSTKNFILLFLSASDDTGGKVGRSDRQVGPTRNNNFPPGLRCLEISHYWQYGHTKLHVCMHYAWVYGGFSDFLTCFFFNYRVCTMTNKKKTRTWMVYGQNLWSSRQIEGITSTFASNRSWKRNAWRILGIWSTYLPRTYHRIWQ